MSVDRPVRVLHAPTNTGGQPLVLSRAERELGLDSTCLSYVSTTVTDEADIRLGFGRFAPLNELKRWSFFWRNYRKYDVFHFNFGLSFFYYPAWLGFLDFWDLPVLKHAGKKVVVTYQGCDARQRDRSLELFEISACAQPDCFGGVCTPRQDARKRRRLACFAKYADKVFVVNPDLLRFLPGAEFMPYASVDLKEWKAVPAPGGGKLRVLHAPSETTVKGTRFVREAMGRIAAEHPDVEYVEVTGVPHGRVRAMYESAHIIVDQLLVGWYGGLAVEAMALGRPVVCYIREEDLEFIPEDMRRDLPIIKASPDSIYTVLKELVSVRRTELPGIGARGRAYVEKWHDPAAAAARMKEVYLELVASGG